MKFTDYISYFKTAAVNNKVLAHVEKTHHTFYEIDIVDILDGLKTKLKFMSMLVECPESRIYDEKSDNIRKMVTGAFTIIKEAKAGDIIDREAVLDATQEVVEQILSKMLNDTRKSRRKSQLSPKIFLEPASVRVQKIGPLPSELYGWRAEFTLNQPFHNNLVLDESKWDNETTFNIDF